MTGIDLLRMQLRGSCDLVLDHARSAGDHWQERAFPDASLPGFITWHCARVVDWGVHAVVRDVPEVASQPEWRELVQYRMGHGAGLTGQEAADVTAAVSPEIVASYAASLRDVIGAWLDGVESADLDHVPDLRRLNQEHPRYASDAACLTA